MKRSYTGQIVILSSLFLLVATLSGCGGSNQGVNLTAQDNGAEITLKRGQTLTISLESNPTTGYSWQVIEIDAAILEQSGEAEYKQASGTEGMTGAGGVETWRFQALAAGQTTLTLGYMRPWESVPPLETFTVQVTIR